MTPTSIQIPDLPSLTRSFQLRTNPACHSTTLASEAWFLCGTTNSDDYHLRLSQTTILSEHERSIFPSAKFGLLSGLCFPTCDPTQLRLLMDFMSILVLSHEKLLRAQTVDKVGWSVSSDEDDVGGVEILNGHELFKHLTTSLTKHTSRASQTWHANFSNSVLSFKRAQMGSFSSPLDETDNKNNAREEEKDMFDHYVSSRRHTSGAHMVFDLVEFALGHRVLDDIDDDDNDDTPENQQNSRTATTRKLLLLNTLDALRNLAADIVALSSDVVAYNQFQSTQRSSPPRTTLPYNAVAVCMLTRHLSVQGATNMVVKLIKDKIREFLEIEQALRDFCVSIDEAQRANGLGSACSWIRSSLSSFSGFMAGSSQVARSPTVGSLTMLPRDAKSARLVGHVIAYTQVLRDYVAGNIHWFYETELYFGTKGEHVREFGWIFLTE